MAVLWLGCSWAPDMWRNSDSQVHAIPWKQNSTRTSFVVGRRLYYGYLDWNPGYWTSNHTEGSNPVAVTFLSLVYEGVSKSFRNHPKVKAPEISFLYFIHRTSLSDFLLTVHSPKLYDGSLICYFKIYQNFPFFYLHWLNDRLCLAEYVHG